MVRTKVDTVCANGVLMCTLQFRLNCKKTRDFRYPFYLGLCSIVLCVYKLYIVVIVGAFSVE